MTDFADQLRTVAASYDASYPPSLWGGGGGSTPPPFPTDVPTPVLASITPTTGPEGTVIKVTADPTGLFAADTVLWFDGAVAVGASIVSSVEGRIPVPAGHPEGSALVQAVSTVVPPLVAHSNTLTFTVAAAPLVINSVDMAAFPLIAVLGSGFDSSSAVEVTYPDTAKAPFFPILESGTRMTFELATTMLGTHQAQVVNSGDVRSNLFSFEVTTLPPTPSGPPVLTSISPNSVVDSSTAVPITATGTGFVAPATVWCSIGLTAITNVVLVSDTQITFDFAGNGAGQGDPTTSGTVTVTCDAQVSNTVPFTLTSAAADAAQAPSAGNGGTPKKRRGDSAHG